MNFFHHHDIAIIIVWYVFSAFVSAMPTPRDGDRWYGTLYTMLHTLAGSLGRAGAYLLPKEFGANTPPDKK